MNPRTIGVGAVIFTIVVVVVGLAIYGGGRSRSQVQPAPIHQVTDVKYDVAVPFVRTFLCTDKASGVARETGTSPIVG